MRNFLYICNESRSLALRPGFHLAVIHLYCTFSLIEHPRLLNIVTLFYSISSDYSFLILQISGRLFPMYYFLLIQLPNSPLHWSLIRRLSFFNRTIGTSPPSVMGHSLLVGHEPSNCRTVLLPDFSDHDWERSSFWAIKSTLRYQGFFRDQYLWERRGNSREVTSNTYSARNFGLGIVHQNIPCQAKMGRYLSICIALWVNLAFS